MVIESAENRVVVTWSPFLNDLIFIGPTPEDENEKHWNYFAIENPKQYDKR